MLRLRVVDVQLERNIEVLLAEMLTKDSGTDEYEALLAKVSKLYKIREQENARRVSPDTWVMVGANIIGILIIVGYERANVVTSKAVAFVQKLR